MRAANGPVRQRPYLISMPLMPIPIHENSEDLFRALFGTQRGVPKNLVLADPRTYDDEINEMILHFASRHLGLYGHENDEWVARGVWMLTPPDLTERWRGF